MSRLFWKLFLAFWVALVLTAIGAAVATSQLARAWQERAAERRERVDALRDAAQTALNAGGREGLEGWLRETVATGTDWIYVFDGTDELLGRRLPEPPDRRRADHRPPFPPEAGLRPPPGRRGRASRAFEGGGFSFRAIAGPDGRPYRMLADLGLRPSLLLHSPLAMGLRLTVALLVSAGVAFVLARYLTTPLGVLRRAARRFTAGDLETRVGPTLGRRRDEIGDLAGDFDEMAERLGRLLTSQRRLLRDLSHELRSPLARLQVALELARKRGGDAASAELQRIELESERLNEMIGQILALARLESSPHRLERASVDLADLLVGVVDDANFECRSTGRRVRLDATGPAPVEANDELLRSAVDNVVRNAIRFTPEGGTVDVDLTVDGAQYRILVRDHGPGVAEAILPHLFEPFFRDDETRGAHPSGNGLGLAIAKRGIELHRGEIAARNAENGGLIVEIDLPRETA